MRWRVSLALPRLVAGTLVMLVFPLCSSAAVAAPGDTLLVSRGGGLAGPGGDLSSDEASISADGRYVAFTSAATNLSSEDVDWPQGASRAPFTATRDVFVRDLLTGAVTLVNGADGQWPAVGAESPAISADGRQVAFVAFIDTTTAFGPRTVRQVFVRDLVTGTTTLASRASGPNGAVADADVWDPAISGDGRYVAFDSDAGNLSGEDLPAHDVFLRDLRSGTTALANRAAGLSGPAGDDDAYESSLSADGHFIAFASDATNLSRADRDRKLGEKDPVRDVFVRDLRTGTVMLASRASGPRGAPGREDSARPAISGDGRRVAFQSGVAGAEGIAVRDLVTRRTYKVDRPTGRGRPPKDALGRMPAISPNGRFVSFTSPAAALTGEDRAARGRSSCEPGDSIEDAFVRDLGTAGTHYASRASGVKGAPARGRLSGTSTVADNGDITFVSDATNLSSEDSDATFRYPDDHLGIIGDVFLRELAAPSRPGPRMARPPGCERAIAAALGESARSLADTLRRLGLRQLRRRRSLGMLIAPRTPGTLRVRLEARSPTRPGARPTPSVLLARLRGRIADPVITARLRFTRRGRRALRESRSVRIVARLSYDDHVGRPIIRRRVAVMLTARGERLRTR